MIGFPDRSDRLGDEGALFLAVPAAGQQVPDAAAEVRSPKQYIRVERKHHDASHRMWQGPRQRIGVHAGPTDDEARAGVGIGISPVSPTGTLPLTPVLRI